MFSVLGVIMSSAFYICPLGMYSMMNGTSDCHICFTWFHGIDDVPSVFMIKQFIAMYNSYIMLLRSSVAYKYFNCEMMFIKSHISPTEHEGQL